MFVFSQVYHSNILISRGHSIETKLKLLEIQKEAIDIPSFFSTFYK